MNAQSAKVWGQDLETVEHLKSEAYRRRNKREKLIQVADLVYTINMAVGQTSHHGKGRPTHTTYS